jgi:hypothetical protein
LETDAVTAYDGSRLRQVGIRAFAYEIRFELSDRSREMEDEPAAGTGGNNILLQAPEAHAAEKPMPPRVEPGNLPVDAGCSLDWSEDGAIASQADRLLGRRRENYGRWLCLF